MFYFQQLLQQGLDGIDRTAMLASVIGIAYTILLIGFLIGLYQAAMRGGDVQSLAITGIKYIVIAIILANWSTVFREVNDSFNQVAQFIDNSSGAGDMFLSWMEALQPLIGIGCSPVLVKGSKGLFMNCINRGLRDGKLHFPESNGSMEWTPMGLSQLLLPEPA